MNTDIFKASYSNCYKGTLVTVIFIGQMYHLTLRNQLSLIVIMAESNFGVGTGETQFFVIKFTRFTKPTGQSQKAEIP